MEIELNGRELFTCYSRSRIDNEMPALISISWNRAACECLSELTVSLRRRLYMYETINQRISGEKGRFSEFVKRLKGGKSDEKRREAYRETVE